MKMDKNLIYELKYNNINQIIIFLLLFIVFSFIFTYNIVIFLSQ